MKELLRKGRDKFTKPLICLIVPLTVLPFFWEQDTIPGKILLVAKFGLMALLWLLHAELISLPENIGLGLVTCSMAVTVKLKGGAGIALLFMVLFLCLVVFPKIHLAYKFKHGLYVLMTIGTCGVAVYGIAMNISAGLDAFEAKTVWNPNNTGIALLAMYFFFQCILGDVHRSCTRWIGYGLTTILFTALIMRTGCRSALLSFLLFQFCFFISYIWKNEKLYSFFHIVVILGSILVFGVVLYLRYGNELIADELLNTPILGKRFFSGREWVWKSAVDYIKDSPFLGNGNQYQLTWVHYSSAHNVPVGIMLCMGILPTLYYFFLQLRPSILFSLQEKCTTWQRIPAICFMAAMVITAFECSLTDAQLNFLFLPLLLGCAPEPVKSEEVSHG